MTLYRLEFRARGRGDLSNPHFYYCSYLQRGPLVSLISSSQRLVYSEILGIRANYFNQISYLCKMGCPAFDEKKRDGKGIYILAYSNEESTAEAYYKDALQTAQKISNLDNSV